MPPCPLWSPGEGSSSSAALGTPTSPTQDSVEGPSSKELLRYREELHDAWRATILARPEEHASSDSHWQSPLSAPLESIVTTTSSTSEVCQPLTTSDRIAATSLSSGETRQPSTTSIPFAAPPLATSLSTSKVPDPVLVNHHIHPGKSFVAGAVRRSNSSRCISLSPHFLS